MLYKVIQHREDGGLEEIMLETDESYTRLMAHSHIHDVIPVTKPVEVEESKPEVVKTKKSKKVAK